MDMLVAAPDSENAVIRLLQVHKEYAHQGQIKPALLGIDLAIQAGEIFGVIGRSGAGKSTLIRMINGLECVSSGDVLVEGESVPAMRTDELVRLRRKVGMIFQHFNLLASRTVFENVALPLRAVGMRGNAVRDRVLRLLEMVGLADRWNSYPAQLSGGQKQRVGIARALVHDPRILLCDEATSALDPETTQSILALLRDINRQWGLTILLITHEMEVVRQVCDRLAVMEQGRVIEIGPTWRVFGQPAHETTRALLRPPGQERAFAELLKRLRPEPAGPGDLAIWSIHYEGSARPPDFAALGLGGGPEMLVDAEVERLQGHTYGRLILAAGQDTGARLPCQSHQYTAPRDAGIRKELLGYVDSLDQVS